MPRDRVNSPSTAFVRTAQIIVGSMVAGCLLLMVLAVLFAGALGKPPESLILTYASIVVAASAVAMRFILPAVAVAQGRKRIKQGTWPPVGNHLPSEARQRDAAALSQLFVVKTVIIAALLEGAAFFLLIVYLIQPSPISLIFAVLLIAFLAGHFPTASRAEAWIENQAKLLGDERSF